jgi:alkylhydroperoxidase/carboxymuconolactone decarboxylase family protein YurZ
VTRAVTSAETTDDIAAEAFFPTSFGRRREVLESLDSNFAANWAQHVARLFARDQLEPRKRYLVLVGQFTMRAELDALREVIEGAIDYGVDPRELLEVILQAYVYAGGARVATAAEVFRDVVAERGLLDDVKAREVPLDASTAGRSLDAERELWSAADRDDPRTAEFLERYGWHGFSTGLRMRPGHHINLVATLDALDPGFLQIWLDTVYQGMYSRRVLDDGTRLLCTVADCFAVGETHQATRHMRGALRQGIHPRELLEVIFQTTAIIGHPFMLPLAVDDLVSILVDEGRIDELLDANQIPAITGIVEARVARRRGVQDALSTADVTPPA